MMDRKVIEILFYRIYSSETRRIDSTSTPERRQLENENIDTAGLARWKFVVMTDVIDIPKTSSFWRVGA